MAAESIDPREYGWKYYGQERPAFAEVPAAGQESVWDYPRPPRTDSDSREVVIRYHDRLIAKTDQAIRILETASPPTFYLPITCFVEAKLVRGTASSSCEWKGRATYWSIVLGDEEKEFNNAAWSYEKPKTAFDMLRGYVGVYPQPFQCTVGGQPVQPQPGSFYAGWITPELVGPFKGEAGTSMW